MKQLSLTLMLALAVAASIGCTTKNYVRQQTTPLINKTNELDDLTAQNTKAIKDVDQRAQAGIQNAQNAANRPIRKLSLPAKAPTKRKWRQHCRSACRHSDQHGREPR